MSKFVILLLVLMLVINACRVSRDIVGTIDTYETEQEKQDRLRRERLAMATS